MQAVLKAIPGLGKPGGQEAYLQYSVTSQAAKAVADRQLQRKLVGDQMALDALKRLYDDQFAKQRQLIDDSVPRAEAGGGAGEGPGGCGQAAGHHRLPDPAR